MNTLLFSKLNIYAFLRDAKDIAVSCFKLMKSWCLIDDLTNQVFKVLLTKEELDDYLKDNPNFRECVDCVECDDAPSITLE